MDEVTIMGAGIFGLSIGFVCAQRGARVRVIDPGGVGAGSSGGIVGALAPHVPENWNPKKAFQFDSLIMAADFWTDVERVGGQDPGYARSGRLQPLGDDRAVQMARTRGENAKELWQGRAEWRVCTAAECGDWAPPSPSGLLVHDTLTGRLHPAQACRALASAIAALGGEVVRAGDARGAVVWATGTPGLIAMTQELQRPVGAGVKGQAALLDIDRRALPQLFCDGVHFVPHGDGTLAIGSTSEREYADDTATDAQLEELLEKARALVPAIADAPILARWAGVRPRSRSRAPLLDHYPGRPGAFVANGGFKIGFGMAPKIAHVMADLVLDGVDAIPDDFKFAAL